MKKTLFICSLILASLLSSCKPQQVKDPTLDLNFDLNGTLLSTDAAANRNPACVLIIQLAKVVDIIPETGKEPIKLKLADGKTYYRDYIEAIQTGTMALAQRRAADKQSMGYYDYFLSSVKSVPIKPEGANISYYEYIKKKYAPPKGATEDQVKQSKKERDEKYCSFVKDYDQESGGDLGRALELMVKAREEQKTEVFDSFFVLLQYLDEKKMPYHIIFRSFGTDLDEISKILENKLGVGFVKGFIINDELKMLAKGAEVLEKKVDEIPNDLVTKVIKDPKEMKEVLDQTPFLAIKDYFAPWGKSGEAWQDGKIFFSSTKNSLGEPILPIFFDDNVVLNFKKYNIVRPVKIVDGKLELDDNPNRLIDTQVFKVETIFAMLYKNYFVELVGAALEHYRQAQAQ